MREHINLTQQFRGEIKSGCKWDCYLGETNVGYIELLKNKYSGAMEYRAHFFECEDPHTYGWKDRRTNSAGSFKTLFAAKTGMLKNAKRFVEYLKGEKARKTPVAYLPASDYQFFPTPSALAGKLFENVNWNQVKTVLEPSAGKGDLVENACSRYRSWRYRGDRYYDDAKCFDCDCIELDTNLQAILKAKGFRVVGDDFLSFNTRKRYDLILMNPPFAEGELHLIHALDLCANGGQVACILNAETIRNPYTNTRHVLVKRLKDLGATIRYVKNGFARAERKSDVEVALVNVSIPYSFVDESIWENLRKAREAESVEAGEQANQLAPKDNIERLILEHDIMCQSGVQLMRCYNGIAEHIRPQGAFRPYITLNIDSGHNDVSKCTQEHVNIFLRQVREHYWQKLLDLPELREKMTSDMQSQYSSLIGEMKEYEFSKFNIMQVMEKIMSQITVGVEAAILQCFDKLSNEHAYHQDIQNDNIHYFNGWKTNKAHCVNSRVIIPTWGTFASAYRKNSRGQYQDTYTTISPHGCFNILSDLEKALNYLDNGETSDINLAHALEAAKLADRSRNIECKYFSVTFFKKGTCHIKFHDQKIVDRLNIYVARNKSWLPPSYGKVRYEEMDDESRRVVDEFQGREAYENVMANQDDYLIDVKETLLLTA